jgi:hypothetical protein
MFSCYGLLGTRQWQPKVIPNMLRSKYKKLLKYNVYVNHKIKSDKLLQRLWEKNGSF